MPLALPVLTSMPTDHMFVSVWTLTKANRRRAAVGKYAESPPGVISCNGPSSSKVVRDTRWRQTWTPCRPAAVKKIESPVQAISMEMMTRSCCRARRSTPVSTGTPPSTGTIQQSLPAMRPAFTRFFARSASGAGAARYGTSTQPMRLPTMPAITTGKPGVSQPLRNASSDSPKRRSWIASSPAASLRSARVRPSGPSAQARRLVEPQSTAIQE